MAKKLEIQEEVSPNLIPMIDIMFLLLLFFMLGADMGQRDLEDVVLPEANSVKEDKDAEGKVDDRLTINIFHPSDKESSCPNFGGEKLCRDEKHWKIGIHGRDYSSLSSLEALLREKADLKRESSNGSAAADGLSELKVMVRADEGAPYGYIQDVMTLCAKAKIYKIECGAAQVVQ
jgi:biopolymer transport protein ExbD